MLPHHLRGDRSGPTPASVGKITTYAAPLVATLPAIVGAAVIAEASTGLDKISSGFLKPCSLLGDAACDARPNSPVLAQVNLTPESFPRAAIVSRVAKRYSFYRVMGDVMGDCPGGVSNSCGGPQTVRRVAKIDKHLQQCAVIGGVLSLVTVVSAVAAAACLAASVDINAIDYAWRMAVSNDQASDGFIPANSQQWPNSPYPQYYIDNADSHAGETRSLGKTWPALRTAMTNIGSVFDR